MATEATVYLQSMASLMGSRKNRAASEVRDSRLVATPGCLASRPLMSSLQTQADLRFRPFIGGSARSHIHHSQLSHNSPRVRGPQFCVLRDLKCVHKRVDFPSREGGDKLDRGSAMTCY